MTRPSTFSPFDILKDTLTTGKRDLTEEEMKSYSPVFMNRLVSMAGDPLIILANMLNMGLFNGMTAEQHHRILQAYLPSRRLYVNYIKKPKENDLGPQAIMLLYKCGSRDAEEIMATMSEEEIDKAVKDVKSAGWLE